MTENWAAQHGVPYIPELLETLAILEGRTASTSAEQLDRDLGVLTSFQGSIDGLVGSVVPAELQQEPQYQQEALRELLGRINNDIDANRALRAEK